MSNYYTYKIKIKIIKLNTEEKAKVVAAAWMYSISCRTNGDNFGK